MKEAAEDLSVFYADELERMVLDPVKFVVDGMVPTGLTILAGNPKAGKSWFALDLCGSVATGTEFLGQKTCQCGVLYLALEDSKNRLQSRYKQVMEGRPTPKDFALTIQASDLNHGLLEQLDDFCEKNPSTGMIVIDTFQRIRSGGSRGENAYSVDYREAGQLKQFADLRKIALVLVHHTRKMQDPSDPFMNVSGTLGITGAADTLIMITRSDEATKLSITGRDVEAQELEMEFLKDICRWHILGTPDEMEKLRKRREYEQNPIVLTVKQLLDHSAGEWTGTATDLIEASRLYRSPISGSAQKLGSSLGNLTDDFLDFDQIIYLPLRNGTGSNRHRFYYASNPFDVSET